LLMNCFSVLPFAAILLVVSARGGAMVGRGISWWRGRGITAKLTSVGVKRRIRLILRAAIFRV
jgi:hypothetical protein